MGELVDRLHAVLRARGVTFEFGTPVERLDASVAHGDLHQRAGRRPAARAARARRSRRRSAGIRMVSLVVVTAFFEPHDGRLRGFGVLFPRSTGVAALGVLFNADIFAGPQHAAIRDVDLRRLVPGRAAAGRRRS